MVIDEDGGSVVIRLNFVETIGLYKLVIGILDDDSEQVSAAIQVELSRIVGP